MSDYMIEHKGLTDEMKAIFGDDMVVRAFKVGYSRDAARKPFNMNEKGINLDQEEIIIELSNGRRVCIWNSEWGGVWLHDNDKEKYVVLK